MTGIEEGINKPIEKMENNGDSWRCKCRFRDFSISIWISAGGTKGDRSKFICPPMPPLENALNTYFLEGGDRYKNHLSPSGECVKYLFSMQLRNGWVSTKKILKNSKKILKKNNIYLSCPEMENLNLTGFFKGDKYFSSVPLKGGIP